MCEYIVCNGELKYHKLLSYLRGLIDQATETMEVSMIGLDCYISEHIE